MSCIVDCGPCAAQIARDDGSTFFVDVREPSEVEETGLITEKAVNIPLGQVAEVFDLSPEAFRERCVPSSCG